jgi:hypothetical protein
MTQTRGWRVKKIEMIAIRMGRKGLELFKIESRKELDWDPWPNGIKFVLQQKGFGSSVAIAGISKGLSQSIWNRTHPRTLGCQEWQIHRGRDHQLQRIDDLDGLSPLMSTDVSHIEHIHGPVLYEWAPSCVRAKWSSPWHFRRFCVPLRSFVFYWILVERSTNRWFFLQKTIWTE